MHGSASAAATMPRASNMSPRQRRTSLTDLIGAGIARAVGSRDMLANGSVGPRAVQPRVLTCPPEPGPGPELESRALDPRKGRLS